MLTGAAKTAIVQLLESEGGLVLPIPKDLCEQVGLATGSQVRLDVREGKLYIAPMVTADDSEVDAAHEASIKEFHETYKKLAE
jgi:antitoxin component of MazEF toxin-antitoxin module